MNLSANLSATSRALKLIPALALVTAASFLHAQTAARSTEVHPDRTLTFHYKIPPPPRSTLSLDGVAKPIPMDKDADGTSGLSLPSLSRPRSTAITSKPTV